MAIRIVRPENARGNRLATNVAHMKLQKYDDSPTTSVRVTIPAEIAKKAGLVSGARVDFYIDDEEHIFGLLPATDGRLKLIAQAKALANKSHTLYVRGAMPDEDVKYLSGASWAYDGIQPIGKAKAITFCHQPGKTDIKTVIRRKIK